MIRSSLVIIFLFIVIYSCQSDRVKEYKDEKKIQSDTLSIEKIRIPTH
jgi:hypothetical protein